MAQAHPGNTSTGCANKKRRNYMITFWQKDYPKQLNDKMSYLITCEDSTQDGKFHGHAFVNYKNAVVMNTVKKSFGADCHIEKPVQNSACIKYVRGLLDKYETRKHNIIEHGTPPNDNGVKNINKIIEDCENMGDIMDKHPEEYCRYRNGLKDLMNRKQSKNRYIKPPNVIWKYGPTGTGKTDEAFNADATHVEYANGFFSDWEDARIISIEEMDGGIPFKTLLKLTDRYHNYYRVNIKGGYKLVDLDTIYITGSKHPRECYPLQTERDSINQLLRRITKLVCTDPNYEYVE